MQISVENTSNLGRKVSVSVPADKIDADTQKRLQKIASTAKLDGFRPGKVPFKVIQKRYGDAVRGEVIGELMQSSLFDALKQKDLRPAGQPSIDDIKAEKGQSLEFVASFEVFPEVELADFTKIKITKPKVEITAADIDEMLQSISKQHVTWDEVKRAAKMDDQVSIDFVGTIDGEAFKGGQAKDVPLVLGSKSFIPGFEEGLVGAKAGDEKEIDVTFPEDYHAKDLAGKEAKFTVSVQEIAESKLPEINDEFAKTMGISEGGLDALKEQVKAHMQRELDYAIIAQLKNEVLDKLLEQNTIELPQSLVKQEIEILHKQMHQGHETADHDHSAHPELEKDAQKRVSLGLLVGEIIKQHKIKVNRTKVHERIEAIAGGYQHPEQVKAWYMGNKEMLAGVESSVLEEQVVDKIIEMADVKDKKASYQEIMNPKEKA